MSLTEGNTRASGTTKKCNKLSAKVPQQPPDGPGGIGELGNRWFNPIKDLLKHRTISHYAKKLYDECKEYSHVSVTCTTNAQGEQTIEWSVYSHGKTHISGNTFEEVMKKWRAYGKTEKKKKQNILV